VVGGPTGVVVGGVLDVVLGLPELTAEGADGGAADVEGAAPHAPASATRATRRNHEAYRRVHVWTVICR
jgi:hypothetical protein